jgi:hypothetical protein
LIQDPLRAPLNGLLQRFNKITDFLFPLIALGHFIVRTSIFGRHSDTISIASIYADPRVLFFCGVEVRSSRLEQTAGKVDFKELFRVFEELEGRSCENELGDDLIDRRRRGKGVEMNEKSVSESYTSHHPRVSANHIPLVAPSTTYSPAQTLHWPVPVASSA